MAEAQYANSNLNQFYDTHLNRNEVKNQFIASIASIEDLYHNNLVGRTQLDSQVDSFGNRLVNINYAKSKSIEHQSRMNSASRSPSLRKSTQVSVKNIYLDDIPQDLYKVDINFKKPIKSIETKKFSHVKSGKIAPVKSNFSIKPIRERIVKENEDDFKNIVLYSHKVDIMHEKHDYRNNKSLNATSGMSTAVNLGGPKIPKPFEINSTVGNVVRIGQPLSTATSGRPNTSKISNRKTSPTSNDACSQQLRFKIGEHRGLIKESEKLYKDTKMFFENMENKLPQYVKFEDLISRVENVYSNIENLKTKNQTSNSKTHYSSGRLNKRGKNSSERSASSKKYKGKNPNILDVELDNETRKRIEEKLELLHVELRQVFDNLNNLNKLPPSQGNFEVMKIEKDHDIQVANLKSRASALLQVCKTFNQRLKIETSTRPSKLNQSIRNKSEPEQQLSKETLAAVKIFNAQSNLNNNYISQENANDHSWNAGKSKNMTDSNPESYGSYGNSHLPNDTALNNVGVSSSIPTFNDKLLINNDFYTSKEYKNTDRQPNETYNADNAQSYNSYYNHNQTANTFYQGEKQPQSTNLHFQNYTSTKYNNNPQSSVNFSSSIGDYNTHFGAQENDSNKLGDIVNHDQSMNKEANNSSSQQFPQASQNFEGEVKLDTKHAIRDELFTSYNVKLPLSHYYTITKKMEPPKEKDWYNREHHLESTVQNKKAIGDDILNSKYISYYKPDLKEEKIDRMHIINEVLGNIDTQITKLKKDFYINTAKDKGIKSKIEALEKEREQIESTYKQGDYFRLLKEQGSKSKRPNLKIRFKFRSL